MTPALPDEARQARGGARRTLLAVLGVVAAYSLINVAVRLFAGSWLAMDDAKTNLFTQKWQWGYQADNPPLFEWLVILLHEVTGGGIASFLVLKYGALIVAAACLYKAVERHAGRADAAATSLGAVLLYQIGWNYHQAFTHSALLVAACCAGIWSGLFLIRARTARSCLLFGAVCGVGLLTKYNFALFALPFLIAAAAMRGTRSAILNPRILLVPLIALPIVLPHALWLLGRSDAYQATLSGTLGLQGTRLSRLGDGLAALLVASVSFFLPWALVAAWLRRRAGPLRLVAEERLLLLTSGIALLFLLGAVAFGVGSISERYVIPALLPAYAGATTVLLRAGGQRSRRLYLRWALGFAILFTALRFTGLAVAGPPFCDECRRFVPYGDLMEALAEVTPEDSIYLVREENTAGNVVVAFPEAQVRSLNLMPFMNPTDGSGRPCFYVWSEDMAGGVPLFPVFAFAYDDPDTVMVDAPWRHPFRKTGWRRTVWGITPLDDPALYRRFCTPEGRG